MENLQADFKARDGQIINGLVSASTLEINGRQFLLAVIQDMMKVRAMEQERLDLEIRLQQAEKMEAIGTLAGGIAHDFNNILAGILGYSELAQKDVGNPEKTTAHLVQIEKGSKRAAELVKQILTFSRKDVYQKHPLQAALAVKEALQLLRSSIPSSIEIRKKIHSASYILADQIKIHQLIINLFTNACHAIGDNQGSICISLTDNVIKKAQTTGSELIPPGIYLVLEVTDTGAGMDPAIMEINPEIPVLLCTGFSETMSEENASAIGIKKILIKLMTDVVMPEMNGRDLAAQMTQFHPGIKLLFMSGYTADVIAHQGVLDAGVAFIQKPFSLADMTQKVREVLDTTPEKIRND